MELTKHMHTVEMMVQIAIWQHSGDHTSSYSQLGPLKRT